MYQTLEEGIRKIRYALLRQMPIEELESLGIRNPEDNLVREVLEEAFSKVQTNLERHRMLNSKHPYVGS
ncbi:hypothetical protein FJZ17_01070 [Candidatus Pacearchaeota archaeon]|nr:hypothetical protein [Candidatus Pacearchaeota archaeon]